MTEIKPEINPELKWFFYPTRLIFFIIFTFFPIFAYGVTIEGEVRDIGSGDLLIGANVQLEEISVGAHSDSRGTYRLIDIPDGQYTIHVSYIGYETRKESIRVDADESPVLQVNFEMKPSVLPGRELVITGNRATEGKTPIAFSNMDRQKIRDANQGQDIPMLISETPNMLSYSESGSGIGYSHLKIRGFNQQRVNVMINNIPLNDPEDHQVYWVDLLDFAESVQDIQVQRGVGNAMYGLTGFGGSVNILTENFSDAKGISMTAGYGDFDTRKYTVHFRSGLIENRYAIYGRYSRALSEGFRENSDIDGWAYFIGAARYDQNMTTKINIYGGPFTLNAAWDATSEEELERNRRANPSHGHPNVLTTDNFNQPHYEMHHEWHLSDRATLNNTLFYILGQGYYESYKSDEDLVDYGYNYYEDDGEWIEETDLTRQKWVKKYQIGWIPRLNLSHSGNRGKLSLGGEFNTFASEHWGEVKWMSHLPPDASPNKRYYDYDGKKQWATLYVHENFSVTPNLMLLSELQLQRKSRTMEQKPAGNFFGKYLNYYVVDYTFLNPKLGLNYNPTEQITLFGNFSMGHREPTDADLFDTWDGADDFGVNPLFAESDTIYHGDGSIKYVEWDDPLTVNETVYDFEFGAGYGDDLRRIKLNLYRMSFKNEIVPMGALREDGSPIRGNADKTLHQGIEISGYFEPNDHFSLDGNISLSQNEFKEFIQYDWGAEIDREGNSIALFPSLIGNLKAAAKYSVSKSEVLNLSALIRHVGKQYLDNTNNEERTVDPYTILGFSAVLRTDRFSKFGSLTFKLWVNNLFDEEYETSGYYDPYHGYDEASGSYIGSAYYFPAPGRNFYGSVTIDF